MSYDTRSIFMIMQHNNFIETAQKYVSLNGLVMNSEQLDRLRLYYDLTLSWGGKMNITNNLAPEAYLCENFLDPLIGMTAYLQAGYSIRGLVDFGAGGGYVGITAKVLCPDLGECVLVESVRKKVSFIQMVIRELQLPQTQAVQGRAEDFSSDHAFFDTIVSRATWCWDDFKLIGTRFLQNNKKLVSFEGPAAHQAQENPPKTVLEYVIQPFERKRFLYCL